MAKKKYILITIFFIVIIFFICNNDIYAKVGFKYGVEDGIVPNTGDKNHYKRMVTTYDGLNAYDLSDWSYNDWNTLLVGSDGTTQQAFCCAKGLEWSDSEGYYFSSKDGGFGEDIFRDLSILFADLNSKANFKYRYQIQILTWYISSGKFVNVEIFKNIANTFGAKFLDSEPGNESVNLNALKKFLDENNEYINPLLLVLDLANENAGEDYRNGVDYKNYFDIVAGDYSIFSRALGCASSLGYYYASLENPPRANITIYSPVTDGCQPMLIVGDPLPENLNYTVDFKIRTSSSAEYQNVRHEDCYEIKNKPITISNNYFVGYNGYHYDGYRLNDGSLFTGESCSFTLTEDGINVTFYFTMYTINVHHMIRNENGDFVPVEHDWGDCVDVWHGGIGECMDNTLCGTYYYRTLVEFDSKNANVDQSNGSEDNKNWYSITLNEGNDINVYYLYTPGKIIVYKINYWDTYKNMPSDTGTRDGNRKNYESINKYLTLARQKAILGATSTDTSSSYNFLDTYYSDDDTKYIGYIKIDKNNGGNQVTGGYNTTDDPENKTIAINYTFGKEDVYIYLYYEKRNVSHSYRNIENSPILNIKNSYIKAFDSYISDYNNNGSNYRVDFNSNFSSKLYSAYDADNDNFLKYNFKTINYGVKQMKLADTLEGTEKYFNFRLASTSSNYLSISNNSSNVKLNKVPGSVLDHALSLDLNGKYTVEPSVKVYVRHMIKQSDGSYVQDNSFANENEIATCKELGFTSLQKVNNGYSERKTVYYAGEDLSNFSSLVKTVGLSGYSEYFEIDKADKLIINRSGTILKDGKIYNCDGYVRTYDNDRSTENITKASQNYTSTSNLQITVENSSKNKIYIDYYYTPESYSEDSASSIGTNSNLNFTSYYNNGGGYQKFNNSTDSTVEGNTYVPSSEYLRPSIVAEICRPRNVKYTISTDGTNPTYDLNNYTAYAINSTSSNIIGTVDGITGSNDRNKVYESGNNTKVYLTDGGRTNIQNVKNNSIDTLRNSSTTSQIFKSNNIKTTLGNITSSKTQKEDFSVQGDHKVGNTYLNGYRNPTGTTYYREYNLLSGASYDASNGTITDERADNVIIYTPAKIKEIKVKSSDDVVDHSEVNKDNVSVIQQNADFTITVNPEENGSYDTVYDAFKQTQKYITATYIAFDFDVKLLDSRTIWDKADNYTKKNVGAGTIVSAGSIIKLKDYEISTASKSVTAKFNAYSTSQETSTAVKASYGNMKVFASTKNQISEDYVISQIKQSSLKSSDSPSSKPYIDSVFIERRTPIYNQESGLESLVADASYVCSKFQKTVALGRIFDFEVTDCLDVNFKNVFRENVDNSAVNKQTGIAYYSGVRSLLLRDSIQAYNTNYYRARENTQRGYVSTILPLGPYKNTSNEYVEAPKLGYRIAFDVKTSGYYNPKDTSEMVRNIKIVPSYYYISKTGDMSTYNDKIQIYYKNASGKYVKFDGSDYSIGFKPNDGYRTLLTDDTTPNLDNLSINIQKLRISGEYSLNSDTMITTSDAGFIQSWYGEFKLPNSAVALAEDENGKVDINKPLTDGYIGVKFDLYCIDTYKDAATGESTVVTLSYNRNNKNDGRTNTTQWDYEGYMNYDVNNQNSFTNMRLRFEKGTLTISNNEEYQKIRGTVVFYDTDARAAEDFD